MDNNKSENITDNTSDVELENKQDIKTDSKPIAESTPKSDAKSDTKPNNKSEMQAVKQKLSALWADKRPFKKRFLLAGAAILAACYTFVFFGPLELVAFSGDSLIYTYHDVVWLLAGAMFLFCAVGTLAVAGSSGKIFNYVVCAIFSTTVCAYVQSMFMNGSLGTLTGDAISWHNMKGTLWVGLLVWFLTFVIFFFIMYLHRKIWSKIVVYVSILLIVMQIVPTVGILIGAYESESNGLGDSRLTTSGMQNYSTEDNVFVFVLDRMDFDYVQEVLNKDGDFFEELDGFTAYDNAISAFARTRPALNQLLTGCEELAYSVPVNEFYRDSWSEDGKDLLRDLSAQNYSIELYTEAGSLFSDPKYMQKYVDNSLSGPGDIIPMNAFNKLMNISAYRYSPIFIKPFFWQDTNYYNQDIFRPDASVAYTFADHEHGPGLKNAVADRSQKGFKLYHFNGPHAPYTLDAEGNLSENETSASVQLMGCMNFLYDAFDKMKELGIYEDATIIITADHGKPIDDQEPLQKATRIGLFYKPSGSAGTKLEWSSAPVCTDNIPATILKNAGADYSLYGKALDEIAEDEEITRVYYKSVCNMGSSNEIEVYTYHVTGDASDFDNWKIVNRQEIENDNKFY